MASLTLAYRFLVKYIICQPTEFVKHEKPPLAATRNGFSIDFLLPDAPERYNQLEHLNYIISRAS